MNFIMWNLTIKFTFDMMNLEIIWKWGNFMEPLGILSLDRKKYTQAMAENLPTLRTRLGLSQTQLADCIGVTRQTISSIENQVRELSWTNFLSLLFLFLQNADTAKLLPVMGIYTDELENVFSFTDLNRFKG